MRRNISSLFRAWADSMGLGGRRDLWDVFGYPANDPEVESYWNAYERGDIAMRIVEAYPSAAWKVAPIVRTQCKELSEGVRQLTEILDFWGVCRRLDVLSGIGRYGGLVIGINDGMRLSEDPAGGGRRHAVTYLAPYSERSLKVARWCNDTRSPRYGMPEAYNLSVAGVDGAPSMTSEIHWKRVFHFTDKPGENPSIGMPRLKPVWNRLLDLNKLLGGSAEMYWQNSGMLLNFNADADAHWDPEEAEKMTQQLDEMMDGARRSLRTRGVEVQQLAPGLMGSNPDGHIDKQIDFVAGTTGIPQRILMGSERGELASSTDSESWENRVTERRSQAGLPLARGAIKQLILLGVLPDSEFEVYWPDSDSLGEVQRSEVMLKKAQSAATLANTMGLDSLMSIAEQREMLGLEGVMPDTETLDYDGDDDGDDGDDPEQAGKYWEQRRRAGL